MNEPTASDPAGTVLLVEDEEALRYATARYLRRRGFSVVEVSDGQAALDLFRESQTAIDVVLLDMTLPVLSGAQVLPELRRICPAVKVILTTAYSHATAERKLGLQDAWAFLSKPYDLATLTKLIAKACARETGTAPGGSS
jgi:CheY-like chemotaxis protein